MDIKTFCENWNKKHNIKNDEMMFFYDKQKIVEMFNDIIMDNINDNEMITDYKYNVNFILSLNNVLLIDISYIDDETFIIDIDNMQLYVEQIDKYEKCNNDFNKCWHIKNALFENGFNCNNVFELIQHINNL